MDKISIEKTYIFKAIEFSKELSDSEKSQVEWAWKKEDGTIQYFNNSGRIDDEGIAIIEFTINYDLAGEILYIMPFIPPQKPSEEVSIKVEVEKVKTVFLTFDDGIQAGTEEVLKVLKDEDVKATFFLTGVHSKYSYEDDTEKTLNTLKEIYENHAIGNHSYSHANNFYSSYYRKGGVKIDNEGTRRSVLDDFVKNEELIKSYIRKIDSGYSENLMLAKNQTIPVARFPGTNTWYINKNLKDIKSTSRGRTFESGKKDSKEEADKLYQRGYKIFGWDVEWHMKFDLAGISREKVLSNSNIDYSNDNDAHPDHFNLYSEEYINKDRLTDGWEKLRDEILDFAHHSNWQPFDDRSKREDKAVLLIHERAFRLGENGDLSEPEKLKKLIVALKELGVRFKTLDDY